MIGIEPNAKFVADRYARTRSHLRHHCRSPRHESTVVVDHESGRAFGVHQREVDEDLSAERLSTFNFRDERSGNVVGPNDLHVFGSNTEDDTGPITRGECVR
jgi:hypothetical protein